MLIGCANYVKLGVLFMCAWYTSIFITGHVLFTLYSVPLADICWKHGISFDAYAGDQQNYLSFQPMTEGSRKQWINRMQNHIHDVCCWM